MFPFREDERDCDSFGSWNCVGGCSDSVVLTSVVKITTVTIGDEERTCDIQEDAFLRADSGECSLEVDSTKTKSMIWHGPTSQEVEGRERPAGSVMSVDEQKSFTRVQHVVLAAGVLQTTSPSSRSCVGISRSSWWTPLHFFSGNSILKAGDGSLCSLSLICAEVLLLPQLLDNLL